MVLQFFKVKFTFAMLIIQVNRKRTLMLTKNAN